MTAVTVELPGSGSRRSRVHVRLLVASGQLSYRSGQGEDDYATDNGTTWIRIATQAEDTGWYLWNVPGPATATAKVRIRFHETPSVTDTSEAVFAIVSP